MANKSSAAQLAAIEKRLKKYVEKDVPAARKVAVKKVLALAKTRVIKAVAVEAKLPSKVVRQRVFLGPETRYRPARITFYSAGVRYISLNPKRTRNGIRAGKHLLKNAWVADGSKGFGEYKKGRGFSATSLDKMQVLQRTKAGRYPIHKPVIHIGPIVNRVMPKIVGRVLKNRLSDLYKHELKRRRNRT